MANMRTELTEQLTSLSLAAQQILLKPAATITERETQLTDYNKAVNAIKDARLNSVLLSKIKALQEDLMKFEKEAEAAPRIQELKNELLALKKEEAARVALTNAKLAERESFKAHVRNEFDRIVMEFKRSCLREIQTIYKQAIDTKDAALLPELLKSLAIIAPPATNKFTAKYISDDEKRELMTGITKPDFSQIRTEMIAEANSVFANFDSDIASGQVVDLTEQIAAIEEEQQTNAAINSIAVEVAPQVSAEGKAIKKLLQVNLEETQASATAVIMHFMKNGWPYLKSRAKWSTLTVAQMAEALTRYCTEQQIFKLEGLTITEVEKL